MQEGRRSRVPPFLPGTIVTTSRRSFFRLRVRVDSVCVAVLSRFAVRLFHNTRAYPAFLRSSSLGFVYTLVKVPRSCPRP